MISTLEVRLNATRVGWLEKLDDFYTQFIFDADWLNDPERPVLGQLFEDRRPVDIVTASVPPCWFAHLLPQGPLRRLIAKSAGIDPDDGFEILRVCGTDLPGAVILSASESQITQTHNREHAEPGSTMAAPEAFQLGFSLAGNQWKLSVRHGDRGLVVPVRGQDSEWIAKFNDPQHRNLPRVEHATTHFARDCGLRVPDVRLTNVNEFERLPEQLPVGDGTVFLTARFDRSNAGRIHMEDFGQILDRPPTDLYNGSYEEIAALLAYLSPEDLEAYIRQVVFCVMVGNGDAHLKNWSIQYVGGRSPRLSPAYDLVPTVLYSRRENLALDLGGSRDFSYISRASFDSMAAAIEWPVEDLRAKVHDFACEIRLRWRAGPVGYDDAERTTIDGHLETIWARIDART